MYEELLREPGEAMIDGAYECFIAALQHKIDQREISQKALAERVDVTAQHLNAIYKERTNRRGEVVRASFPLQQKIAEVFGYSIVDFLKLGQRVLEKLPPDASRGIAGEKEAVVATQHIPIGPTDYMDPDHLVSAVMAFTRQW